MPIVRFCELFGDEPADHFHLLATVLGDEDFVTWVRETKWQKLDDKGFVAQVLPGPLSGRVLHTGFYAVNAGGERTQERVARPQGGDVSLSTTRGASLDGHHAHIWVVECGLGQFYHDPDSATY